MKFIELTDEQRGRIANAEGPEEILEMAKAEGYELTDDELEAISVGGFWKDEYYCPQCGSHDVGVFRNNDRGVCFSCGYEASFDAFYH